MSFSLRQTIKDRLLGLLKGVPAESKLMVVDERALGVIDAVCTLTDIADCGVCAVESIENHRQPFSSRDVIYIIFPSHATITAIIKDFDRAEGPLNAHAYIFAINEISEELFCKLGGCQELVQRVKQVLQVHSDFIATEARFFHFASSKMKRLIGNTEITVHVRMELEKMASKLLSVWVALGEYPIVKYHRTEGDLLAPMLAELLQTCLEKHAAKFSLVGGPNENAEIIIFSRTFDLLSPVLHEFTYQAMAADLLGIQEGDSGALRYSVDDGKTATVLDESDGLWQALRHNHIVETSNMIIQQYKTFTTDNKAAINRSKGSSEENAKSLEELREIVGAMKEFYDLKIMYNLHIKMAQACFSAMSAKHLMDVAKIEQILATGRDEVDSIIKPSTQWPSVSNLLSQNYLSKEDKLRLVIIYALCTGDIKEMELPQYRFDKRDISLVKRLRDYGQQAIATRLSQKKSFVRSLSLIAYEVKPFIPSVKYAIEAALLNNLDQSLYPSVRPASSSSGKTGAVSLRSGGAASTSASNQRIVMAFIIGGASHSEVRVAYETSNLGKGEVIIGSTHLMHPEMFLRSMR